MLRDLNGFVCVCALDVLLLYSPFVRRIRFSSGGLILCEIWLHCSNHTNARSHTSIASP